MKWIYSIIALSLLTACKKAGERSCFKGTGDYTEISVPLDSVSQFKLYKNIRYEIFQDTMRCLKIKGGENLVSLVSLQYEGTVLSIHNENSCNFLRDAHERMITVEIHYPHYERIYAEPSDSMIFKSTIQGDSLFYEIRNGGGSAVLDVDLNFLSINVSYGTADYTLTGYANNSEVKIQNNGFADASGFTSPYMFLFSNSTASMRANLEGTNGLIQLEGTGNIYYLGAPGSMQLIQPGSGEFIKI